MAYRRRGDSQEERWLLGGEVALRRRGGSQEERWLPEREVA